MILGLRSVMSLLLSTYEHTYALSLSTLKPKAVLLPPEVDTYKIMLVLGAPLNPHKNSLW